MAKMTIAKLREAGACRDELERLQRQFGESVEITEEWCIAHASECEWEWASRMLSPPARVEYYRTEAAALAEYDRVVAAAWAEYDRIEATARAEYDRIEATAWARGWIADHEARPIE